MRTLCAQMELEQRLRNRADMEAELLTLMATLADALHQGNAEADGLATSIRSSAAQAQKVRPATAPTSAPHLPRAVVLMKT